LAGKIRYLLYVDGRYYARRVVPAELRKILGKRELQEPLGADRRKALEQLPVALVRIGAKFDHARAVLAAGEEQLNAERESRSRRLSHRPNSRYCTTKSVLRFGLSQPRRVRGQSYASLTSCPKNRQQLNSINRCVDGAGALGMTWLPINLKAEFPAL